MPTDEMVEKVARAIRQHIKVDATGLSPSIASAFIVGVEDAARAALAAAEAGETVPNAKSPTLREQSRASWSCGDNWSGR